MFTRYIHNSSVFPMILGALALVASLLPAVAEANATFYVPINRSELMTTSVDMGEVIIADPEIADVYVHDKQKISIVGKSLGITTVRLFDAQSRLIRSATVQVTYDLPAIRKALNDFLPYERVGVEMVNTKIALTGEISNAAAAATAVDIAREFIKTKVDPARPMNASTSDARQAESEILNLMSVISGQQVMLRIRVGEIQRSALKQLGVGLQAVKSSGDLPFQIATGGGLGSTIATGVAPSFNFNVADNTFGSGALSYLNSAGNGIAVAIDALERDGLFKILAEPNLVALSGEKAEFLAGGEFPIPVPQGGSSDTIVLEYKPFGVAVNFTPYVLSNNRIRIQVQPEVSEISNESAIQIGNLVAPSFTTRRASTTVELAPGESFMIAGLIRDTLTSNIDQIPGLSEIPILSSLFRSTSYQRNETELVLAVTPYIVDPLRSNDVKLPTDDFRPASFMENVFYGALGRISNDISRLAQTPSVEGPIGFMVD